MMNNSAKPITMILCALVFSTLGISAEDWDVQAKINVEKTGITEAVLLPELLSKSPDGAYDISLIGPDNNPRPFEMYMRDDTDLKRITLKAGQIKLTPEGGFLWECELSDQPLTDLRIHIGDRNYVGKMDVQGKVGTAWRILASDQAIYRSGGAAWANIDIPDMSYSALRLTFMSFDPQYRQKMVPIQSVTGYIKRVGRSSIVKSLDLSRDLRRTESDPFTELKTLLPGKGIEIESVVFSTQIQFQGQWELGYEMVEKGKSVFIRVINGTIAHVDHDSKSVTIPVQALWPEKSIMIRLKPETGYLGPILGFTVRAKLPRLVFSADMPGVYVARTGVGEGHYILAYPGDASRKVEQTLEFYEPQRNPMHSTQSLVEQFQMAGGPFQEAGYSWHSPVELSEPGYYRLTFNTRASLDEYYKNVRLVKNGMQVPFFFGLPEDRSVPFEFKENYNSERNHTTWFVTIPEISARWNAIKMESNGIFIRDVIVSRKKPGPNGWERVLTKTWRHTVKGETMLRLAFPPSLYDQKQIKIDIGHGDNQAMKISSIEGTYSAPSIHFLAHESGTYQLFGGNARIGPAAFDLMLIQKKLMETLPEEIAMAEIEENQPGEWTTAFLKQFQERGWGLYLILGLVTLLLIGIIIKLFPKSESSGH